MPLEVQPLDVQKRVAAMREALAAFLLDKVRCGEHDLRREVAVEDGERAWRAFCRWHPGEDLGAVDARVAPVGTSGRQNGGQENERNTLHLGADDGI